MNETTPEEAESRTRLWLLGPMLVLVGAMQQQTAWTWRHSGRVARYAVAFGKQLHLDREQMLALHCASLLHDVGKVAISPGVLDKVDKLTRDEWYTITKHSMASSLMLRTLQLPRQLVAIAQAHHEWYNGAGYPLGLQGEAIPLGARILAIADAFDAMSSDRPYRPALAPDRIAGELRKGAGSQFDPQLIHTLIPLITPDTGKPLPGKRLRVVSDDLDLCHQLWFAAYPLGWEIEVWPGDWAKQFPEELPAPANIELSPVPRLTVVDGHSLRRVPPGTLEGIDGPCLWIDPPGDARAALYRPLDLASLLDYLDVDDVAEQDQIGPIRVVLADPFQLFRQGLKRCLDDRQDVRVVGEARSPREYRELQRAGRYDVAIVASDLFEGTRSTSPLRADDYRLGLDEIPEDVEQKPTIVLVADEDVVSTQLISSSEGSTGAPRRAFIHRGAPVEVLIEAIVELLDPNQVDLSRERNDDD